MSKIMLEHFRFGLHESGNQVEEGHLDVYADAVAVTLEFSARRRPYSPRLNQMASGVDAHLRETPGFVG